MALPAIQNKGQRTRAFPVASGQTYVEGAVLLLDASGDLILAGADPAVILGFAAEPAVAANLAPADTRLVYVAYPDSTFWIEGSSVPVAADVGDQYELSVDAGVARLDKTAQVNNRFTIESVDLDRDLYEVSIIGANRQFQTTT